MTRSIRIVLCGMPLAAGSVAAQPVGGSFVGGVMNGSGSPSPATFLQVAIAAMGAAGGGQTGGGFVDAEVHIAGFPGITTVSIAGDANHLAGIGGSTGYGTRFGANAAPAIMSLPVAAAFTIVNASSRVPVGSMKPQPYFPVSFLDAGGSPINVLSGILPAGLYLLDFEVRANGQLGNPNTFRFAVMDWQLTLAPACYANCDASTGTPALTPNDFQCFINAYAAGSAFANCDGSTGAPILTPNDFQCYLNSFAGGCS